jgi:hypothetical protein
LLVAADLALRTDRAAVKSWQSSDNGSKYGVIAHPGRISTPKVGMHHPLIPGMEESIVNPRHAFCVQTESHVPKSSGPAKGSSKTASASTSKSASSSTLADRKGSEKAREPSHSTTGAEKDDKKRQPATKGLTRKESLKREESFKDKGKAKQQQELADAQKKELDALMMDVDFSSPLFPALSRSLISLNALIRVLSSFLPVDAEPSSTQPPPDSQAGPPSSSLSSSSLPPPAPAQEDKKKKKMTNKKEEKSANGRRVRKTRVVQRKKTETDAKGYRRTVTVEEEESYSESEGNDDDDEDEGPSRRKPKVDKEKEKEKEKKRSAPAPAPLAKARAEGTPAPSKKKKGPAPGGQTNLNSFFKKG